MMRICNPLCFILGLSAIILSNGCASKKNISSYGSATDRGLNMSISQRGDNSELSISTSDPVLLRTLLMQSFTIDIPFFDTDTLKIEVPGADRCSGKIQRHPGEVKAQMDGNAEKRPDIRPVLGAIRQTPITLSGSSANVDVQGFEVDVNPENGVLEYKISLTGLKRGIKPMELRLHSSPKLTGPEAHAKPSHGNDTGRPQPFGADGPKQGHDSRRTVDITVPLK